MFSHGVNWLSVSQNAEKQKLRINSTVWIITMAVSASVCVELFTLVFLTQ